MGFENSFLISLYHMPEIITRFFCDVATICVAKYGGVVYNGLVGKHIFRDKRDGGRMQEEHWYKCPNCGFPRMLKYFDDTKIVNFPGYCKKCKTETIIKIEPKSRIVNR